MRYEGCIETPKGVRYVTVEAEGIRAAYSLVEAQCAEGEFVRGVNPID